MAKQVCVSFVLLILCYSIVQRAIEVEAGHRYNLHEPLFADDGAAAGDAHTVSAGTRSPSPSSPSRFVAPKASSLLPPVEHRPQSSSSGLPPLASTFAISGTPRAKLTSVVEPDRSASVTKWQDLSQDATIAEQQQLNERLSAAGSASKHWSALRNYYDKLRPVAWDDARTRQQAPFIGESQQKLYEGADILQQRQRQQQQAQVYTVEQLPIKYPIVSTNLKSPFELPQQAGQRVDDCSRAGISYGPPPALAQFEQIAQQPISDWSLDFPGLPDKIFFNQQQIRARHQQDTFGSLVDRGIQEQLQQEEMNCGPRNLVRNLVAASRRLQSLVGFGEYPSHMGLYNGSQPSDNNFLCSATLIHSRFALTLASCVANITANSLFVRTGDWNLNRKISESDRQLVMMVKQVTRVHPFPRYQGNDHNLALLEWTKPIEFPTSEYISPACQPQSRSSLRMRYCWAPVRNISISSYFDAEGEGETKLRQDVHMVEVPISLIPNDDLECRRQTLVESFSFQHPNYICSSDFRQNQWRSKLRQSQYLGSGIYCDEGGMMSLVSMMHPIQTNMTADFGYIDLSYYRPWMRNVIASQTGFIKYSQ